MRLSAATMKLIQQVEHYVAYGYPTLKTVRDVIYKRGHGKINRQRTPLTDNTAIEAALGRHGIICMEDLVHEIYTVGPNFKEASAFLWPFKLGNFRSELTKTKGTKGKRNKSVEGADPGNQHKLINDIIIKMN